MADVSTIPTISDYEIEAQLKSMTEDEIRRNLELGTWEEEDAEFVRKLINS